MSREAFALLDGAHPVVPSLMDDKQKGGMQGLKEKRKNPQKGTVSIISTLAESRHALLSLSSLPYQPVKLF